MYSIPKIPIAQGVEKIIEFMVDRFSGVTNSISNMLEAIIDMTVHAILSLNPIIVIVAISTFTLIATRRWRMAALSLGGFLLILNLGLWSATVNTIALVIISTLIAIMFSIPLGIIAALNQTAHKLIMPVLDFMQTMPAFVYLIPAIPFFGLGKVSAIFSTVIFSLPPSIRLTDLGIRQIPEDLVEAADAFGSSRMQKLTKIQLPLAMPTIMAGINQTVMLSLSMVVVAAMIGAKGLGGEVWKAIQRLESGKGFEAGLGIVILAIVLDRILQSLGKKRKTESH